MRVAVRVYASLRQYLPAAPLGQAYVLELPAGATVGDALDSLGIPRGETKSCFVAHVRRELDFVLSPDDELAAFPPVAGGRASTDRIFAEARAEAYDVPEMGSRSRTWGSVGCLAQSALLASSALPR